LQLFCLISIFRILNWEFFFTSPGPRPFAYAQEEDADEGLVDVDGDDTSVTDDGTDGAEETDLTGPKASPHADTTILFIKPEATAGTTLGKYRQDYQFDLIHVSKNS